MCAILSGCESSEASRGCDGANAKTLVAAAKASPLLTEVPPAWRPDAIYGECDRDDDFVVAGRSFATTSAALFSFLSLHGVLEGRDADGQPCRTITVNGTAFYVELRNEGVEIRRFLTEDNSCRTDARLPSPSVAALPYGIYLGDVLKVDRATRLLTFRVTDGCGRIKGGVFELPLDRATFHVHRDPDPSRGSTDEFSFAEWADVTGRLTRWEIGYSPDELSVGNGPSAWCDGG
jgi:hypothetical protein